MSKEMAASAQAPVSPDNTEEVIFVISDSEGDPDNHGGTNTSETGYISLFDEFVVCSNKLLNKIRDEAKAGKIEKHLLKVFKAARQDYISSEEFTNTVRLNLTKLQKPDIKDQTIFSVIHDVVIHLKNATNKSKKKKGTKANSDTEKNRDKTVSNAGTETHTVDVKKEPASDSPDQSEPCGSKGVTDVTHTVDVKTEEASDNPDRSTVCGSKDVTDLTHTVDVKKAVASNSPDRSTPCGSKGVTDVTHTVDVKKAVASDSPDRSTPCGSKGVTDVTHTVDVKKEAVSDSPDRFTPCGSKGVTDVTHTKAVKKESTIDNEDVSHIPPTRDGKQVAASKSPDGDKPSGSKDKSVAKEEDGVDKAKNHKIRRMEKLMGRLDREIHRYSEKDLSLEEMERDDSSHMIEHKLRTRFVEAWRKWCKLKGYEAKTGRGIEKKVKYEGTRYPEINLKIRKLVKHNKFPDFFDVYHVIEKTNEAEHLGIHKFGLHPLATEVFKDIGEKLSKRRINDDLYNAGYASLIDAPDDPANENQELMTKLKENATKGREMMDKVLEKYSHMARERHAPGVEPDYDRTSEPGVDGSEDDMEEGDWIEYVSDSDGSQSAEPSVAKSPDTEATTMETCPDRNKTNGNKREDSKKRPLEVDSFSDSISSEKKIKLEHSSNHSQETGKTFVAVNGISQSGREVKTTNESQTAAIFDASQGIVKVDSIGQGVSVKLFSETKAVTVLSQLTQCSAGLHKKKSIDLSTSSSQQTQPQAIHLPSAKALTFGTSNTSKKQLGKVMANMEPLKVVKGGIKLLLGKQSNVGPSSTRSLPTKTVSHRTQLNSLPSTTSSSSMNSKVPSRRIQLNSFASTTSSSSLNNKVPSHGIQLNSFPSTSSAASTNSKFPSKRILLSVHPSTSTKPGIQPVQVPSNRTQTNGKVVNFTRTVIPNQRTNATRVRQDVASLRKKNFTQKTHSMQSNGGQESYHEDDDGVIVID